MVIILIHTLSYYLSFCIIYIIFLNLPYYYHYSLCFHMDFCCFLICIHPYLHFAPCFLLTTYILVLLFPWISGTYVLTSAPFAKVMISMYLSSIVVIYDVSWSFVIDAFIYVTWAINIFHFRCHCQHSCQLWMDCYANEARMFLFQHNNLTQRIGIMANLDFQNGKWLSNRQIGQASAWVTHVWLS